MVDEEVKKIYDELRAANPNIPAQEAFERAKKLSKTANKLEGNKKERIKQGWNSIKSGIKKPVVVGAGLIGAGAMAARDKLRRTRNVGGYGGGSIGSNPEGLLILLAIGIHLAKWLWFDFNVKLTWGIDVAFALFFLFLFCKDRDNETIREVLIVLFLSIIIPLIGGVIGYNPQSAISRIAHFTVFNQLLLPWWFYYFVLVKNSGSTKALRITKNAVIIFWIIFALYTLPAQTYLADIESQALTLEQYEASKNVVRTVLIDFPKSVWHNLVELPGKIRKSYKRTIAEATGEYYVGEIDSKAKEQLGVYIEKIETSRTKPYNLKEPVIVSAYLKAETLKDPIDISLDCKPDVTGKVIKPESLEVRGKSYTSVDCIFKDGLKEGTTEVKISADFNFETSAYIISYFVDKKDIRWGEDDTDILSRYGIINKDPKAIYTSGPVNIGMSAEKQPIWADRNDQITFPLKITLMNTWDGKIKDVNKFIIQLPSSIELSEDSPGKYCGGKTFKEISCTELGEEECDDSSFNIYKLEGAFGPIEKDDYETIPCRLKIRYMDDVFGIKENKFIDKYFRVLAGYDYELSKEIGVTVIKRKDGIEIINQDCCDHCTTCTNEGSCTNCKDKGCGWDNTRNVCVTAD